MPPRKQKNTIESIRKRFQKIEDMYRMEKYPTGSLVLDLLLEGGIPKGKIIELWGAPSGGKTTLALMFARSMLEHGKSVLYIDLEDSLTREYLERLGIEGLDVYLPDTSMEAIQTIIGTDTEPGLIGVYDMIIFDSVAAIQPDSNTFGGAIARVISQFLLNFIDQNRKLPPAKKTTLVLINQIRAKIGNTPFQQLTESGGYALQHYVQLKLKVDRVKLDKEKQIHIIGVSIPKSKTCTPYTSCEIPYSYVEGRLIKGEEMFMLLNFFDMIEKKDGEYVILTDPQIKLQIKQDHQLKKWLDKDGEEQRRVYETLKKKVEEYASQQG